MLLDLAGDRRERYGVSRISAVCAREILAADVMRREVCGRERIRERDDEAAPDIGVAAALVELMQEVDEKPSG